MERLEAAGQELLVARYPRAYLELAYPQLAASRLEAVATLRNQALEGAAATSARQTPESEQVRSAQ
jgi:hypothetical protein